MGLPVLLSRDRDVSDGQIFYSYQFCFFWKIASVVREVNSFRWTPMTPRRYWRRIVRWRRGRPWRFWIRKNSMLSTSSNVVVLRCDDDLPLHLALLLFFCCSALRWFLDFSQSLTDGENAVFKGTSYVWKISFRCFHRTTNCESMGKLCWLNVAASLNLAIIWWQTENIVNPARAHLQLKSSICLCNSWRF